MTFSEDVRNRPAEPTAWDRAASRVITREIAAASRALAFAEKERARCDNRLNAIRLQYCEAWLKSLTEIARVLP